MKHSSSAPVLVLGLLMSGTPHGQQSTDQWADYQHDSDFSSLIQITPANAKTLVPACTFKYGAGSSNPGYVVVAAGGGTAIGDGLPTSDALVAFKLGTTPSQ
jgi:hypothetical protein